MLFFARRARASTLATSALKLAPQDMQLLATTPLIEHQAFDSAIEMLIRSR
jgi:hypothetical protein